MYFGTLLKKKNSGLCFHVLKNVTDPACQDINTHDHCYVLDPFCPTQTFNEQLMSSSTSNVDVVLAVCALIYVTVAICFIVVVWNRKRRNLRKKYRSITGKIDNCPTILRTFIWLLLKQFKYYSTFINHYLRLLSLKYQLIQAYPGKWFLKILFYFSFFIYVKTQLSTPFPALWLYPTHEDLDKLES